MIKPTFRVFDPKSRIGRTSKLGGAEEPAMPHAGAMVLSLQSSMLGARAVAPTTEDAAS